MKRLLAIVLILALSVFALTSCASGVDEVKHAYSNSAPKRIVVVSTQSFGTTLLDMTTTIVEGVLETGEAAGYKTVVGDRFRSLEEGSGNEIVEYIENVDTTEWYRASLGTSTDKGRTWNADGTTFLPEVGLIAINLDPSLLTNTKFDGKEFSFTVKAANAAKVFSDELVDVAVDIDCTIVIAGAQVSSIAVSWIVPASESGAIGDEVEVSIVATYGYDIEPVTLK